MPIWKAHRHFASSTGMTIDRNELNEDTKHPLNRNYLRNRFKDEAANDFERSTLNKCGLINYNDLINGYKEDLI